MEESSVIIPKKNDNQVFLNTPDLFCRIQQGNGDIMCIQLQGNLLYLLLKKS